MSSRLLGIILLIISVLAFHLLGSQPETQALWQRSIADKIYSDPISVGDRVIFVAGDKGKREYRLYEIDNRGNTTAQSVQLTNLPYDPIGYDNVVVVGDRAGMIRGFSVPGLQLVWESATMQPFQISPLKSGNNLIVQSEASVLFCLDSKTGKPVWDYTFTDTLINFGVGKTIVCLHGYASLKDPRWKATVLDPETGEVLWKHTDPLNADTPLFIQDVCILTSSEGEVIIADQFSGNLLYRHPLKGVKALQVLDEHLIMLAAGGSRLISLSLMDGKSWTTTMQSNLTGIAKYGNRLLIADKKDLRCINIDDGSSFWIYQLEDVYSAVPFHKGIFITHKDSFFSRETYGSYFETDKPKTIWVAHGSSNFVKPLLISSGDLLLSYNGEIRLLPRSSNSTVPGSVNFSEQKMPSEPSFWKNKNASETTPNTASRPSILTPNTKEKTDSDAELPVDSPDSEPTADDWNKKDG